MLVSWFLTFWVQGSSPLVTAHDVDGRCRVRTADLWEMSRQKRKKENTEHKSRVKLLITELMMMRASIRKRYRWGDTGWHGISPCSRFTPRDSSARIAYDACRVGRFSNLSECVVNVNVNSIPQSSTWDIPCSPLQHQQICILLFFLLLSFYWIASRYPAD